MTFEGRMARGEENFKRSRFMNNSETLEYMETVKSGDVDYSSMNKKKLLEEAKDMDLKGDETKDDLIVLLENKSDGVK